MSLGGFGGFGSGSGFGSSNPSGFSFGSGPFGQSSTPAFGASTTGGFFGNSQPAFGAASSGSTMFGASSSGFGGTGVFGSAPPSSPFGSSNVFGASSSTFGAQAPSSPFGNQLNAPAFGAQNSSPFGGGTSSFGGGFGATSSTQPTRGTAQIPFNPHTEQEQGAQGAGPKNVQFYNLVAMKQYQQKSPEELRSEDYQMGNKGRSGGGIGGSTIGGFGSPTPSGGGFGGTKVFASPSSGASFGGGFGASTAQGGFGGFGSSAPAFGASSGSVGLFSGGGFGQSSTSPFGASTAPAFGSTTTGSGFGGFGNSAPALSTGGFGGGFGASSSPFGASSSGPSPFGGGFGSSQTGNIFGQSSGSAFGSQTGGVFAGGGGGFGQTAASGAMFAASSGSVFGAASAPSFGQAGASPFGASSTATFGTNTGNLFGGTGASQPMFGQQQTTGNLFGASSPAAFGTSVFGAQSGAGFGQPGTSLFGQQSGGSFFGQSQPSTLFGNTQPAGQFQQQQQQPGVQGMAPQAAQVQGRPSVHSDVYGRLGPDLPAPLGAGTQPKVGIEAVPPLYLKRPQRRTRLTLPREYPMWSREWQMDRRKHAWESSSYCDIPWWGDSKKSDKPSVWKETRPAIEDEGNDDDDNERDMWRSSKRAESVKARLKARKDDLESGDLFVRAGNEAGPSGEITEDGHLTEKEIKKLLPKVSGDDYYVKPNMQGLTNMLRGDKDALKEVNGFEVGRTGYGKVRFLVPVNVEKLNVTKAITIRKGGVAYGADHAKKRPGLNKPCEVTLYNVFKLDKASKEKLVDDKSVQAFEAHLKRYCKREGAEFVSYAADGTWKFRALA